MPNRSPLRATADCLHCDRGAVFGDRGWQHPEGGLYVMRCEACGWQGAPYPAPAFCPECGQGGLRDDHGLTVKRS